MKIINKNIMYEERINHVQDYINNNLDSDLTLDKLAKISTFSPYYFHKIFKAMTSETLNDYIIRLRLEKACFMLRNELNKRIIDIAYECGFGSSASFSKIFKQHYKISPTQWRNYFVVNLKKNQNSNYDFISLDEDTYAQAFFNDKMKKNGLIDYKIEEIPNYHIVYTRKIGTYESNRIELWKQLIKWGMARNLINEKTVRFGIFHDNPNITSPEKCRYDASLVIPDDYILNNNNICFNTREICGGKYIIYTYRVTINKINNIWNDIFSLRLSESGYQLDYKPIFERYIGICSKKNLQKTNSILIYVFLLKIYNYALRLK